MPAHPQHPHTMNISNYQTGELIGRVTSIDLAAYEAHLAADITGTGAIRAGDWISDDELTALGIDADTTVFESLLPA